MGRGFLGVRGDGPRRGPALPADREGPAPPWALRRGDGGAAPQASSLKEAALLCQRRPLPGAARPLGLCRRSDSGGGLLRPGSRTRSSAFSTPVSPGRCPSGASAGPVGPLPARLARSCSRGPCPVRGPCWAPSSAQRAGVRRQTGPTGSQGAVGTSGLRALIRPHRRGGCLAPGAWPAEAGGRSTSHLLDQAT